MHCMHTELSLTKVQDIYKSNIMTFVYDCLSGNTIDIFTDYYESRSKMNYPNTRKKDRLIQKKTRTDIGGTSVQCVGAKLWNALELDFASFRNKKSLKMNLKETFLSTYTDN